MDKETLENLTNGQLSDQYGFVHYTKVSKKDWLKVSPRLVAHAGGTVRGEGVQYEVYQLLRGFKAKLQPRPSLV